MTVGIELVGEYHAMRSRISRAIPLPPRVLRGSICKCTHTNRYIIAALERAAGGLRKFADLRIERNIN